MNVKRGAPRPVSLPKPALALVAVTAALFGIARTTGSGWLVVLIAFVAAVALLSVLLPVVPIVRARVELEAPSDGTAGVPLHVTVSVKGTSTPMVVRVRESDGVWTAVAPPVRGRLEATPARRGIVERLTVDVRCAAPLGLVYWGRTHAVTLPRALEVGPAPIAVGLPPPSGAGGAGNENRVTLQRGDDLVRGVRDYRPGDPIKNVHWAATAHHRQLMVKEHEAAAAPPMTIAADLRANPERAASFAAGLALAALRAGMPVTLLTVERSGQVAAPVRTPTDVSRRLARAIPGQLVSTGIRDRLVWVDGEGVHP